MYAQHAHTPNTSNTPASTSPASVSSALAPVASSRVPPLPASRVELLDDLRALVEFLTEHPYIPVTAVRCWYSADLDIGDDNDHVGRLVIEHIADELGTTTATTGRGDHATGRDFGDRVEYAAYYLGRAVRA